MIVKILCNTIEIDVNNDADSNFYVDVANKNIDLVNINNRQLI